MRLTSTKQLILILIYCLSGQFSFGQGPRFKEFTRLDGVPHRSVFCAIQEPSGLMLVGSALGLFRFDGFSFEKVPYAAEANQGKINTSILDIGILSDSSFFFHDFNRRALIYRGDSIRLFRSPALPKDFEVDKHWFQQRYDDEVYLLDKKALYILDVKTGEMLGHHTTRDVIKAAIRGEEGETWLATRDTLWCKYPDGATYSFLYERLGIGKKSLLKTIRMRNGRQYLIDRFEGKTFELIQGEAGPKVELVRWFQEMGEVFDLFEDPNGELWFCTNNGLWSLGLMGQPQRFKEKERIIFMDEDVEGNTWLTIFPGKLAYTPSLHVQAFKEQLQNLPYDIVEHIVEVAENELLIIFEDGHYWHVDTTGVQEFSIPNEKRDIRYGDLKGAGKGIIANEGYFHFLNEDWSPSRLSPKYLGRGYVQVEPLRQDYWLLGAYKRVDLMHWQGNKFRKIRDFHHERWSSLLRDRFKERVWITGLGKISYFEKDSLRQIDLSGIQPLNLMTSMVQANDSTVWVAAWGLGFIGIKDDKVEEIFVREDGMVGSTFQIFKVEGDTIWAGSEKGLHKINRTSREVLVYDVHDGLVASDALAVGFVKDQIWMGTNEGISVFPRSYPANNTTPPRNFITNVSIWGQDTTLYDQYELKHDQNHLTFRFKGIAFRSNGNFSYQYRMIGIDTNWIEVPATSNVARFPQLNPGNYRFEVFAVNEDKVHSEQVSAIDIRILYPFWQTWWFIGAMICLVSLALFLGLRAYIHNVNRQNELSQNLIESELTALKSRMNPHFLFNALNAIQSHILKKDVLMANRSLGDFARLMRMILEMSAKQYVSLAEELESLELYISLENSRFEDPFNYELELGEEIDPEAMIVPSMLIQPYVENAIKHGLWHKKENKHLRIKIFKKEYDLLNCIIEDNGVGREKTLAKEKAFPSRGTGLTLKRLQLLNERQQIPIHIETTDLYEASGAPAGTRVEIIMPLTFQ